MVSAEKNLETNGVDFVAPKKIKNRLQKGSDQPVLRRDTFLDNFQDGVEGQEKIAVLGTTYQEIEPVEHDERNSALELQGRLVVFVQEHPQATYDVADAMTETGRHRIPNTQERAIINTVLAGYGIRAARGVKTVFPPEVLVDICLALGQLDVERSKAIKAGMPEKKPKVIYQRRERISSHEPIIPDWVIEALEGEKPLVFQGREILPGIGDVDVRIMRVLAQTSEGRQVLRSVLARAAFSDIDLAKAENRLHTRLHRLKLRLHDEGLVLVSPTSRSDIQRVGKSYYLNRKNLARASLPYVVREAIAEVSLGQYVENLPLWLASYPLKDEYTPADVFAVTNRSRGTQVVRVMSEIARKHGIQVKAGNQTNFPQEVFIEIVLVLGHVDLNRSAAAKKWIEERKVPDNNVFSEKTVFIPTDDIDSSLALFHEADTRSLFTFGDIARFNRALTFDAKMARAVMAEAMRLYGGWSRPVPVIGVSIELTKEGFDWVCKKLDRLRKEKLAERSRQKFQYKEAVVILDSEAMEELEYLFQQARGSNFR